MEHGEIAEPFGKTQMIGAESLDIDGEDMLKKRLGLLGLGIPVEPDELVPLR
jgi:hypothetical protein